jgi:hypothetical protein
VSEYIQPPLTVNPEALLEIYTEYMSATIPGWKGADGNLDFRVGGGVAQMVAQLNEASTEGATNFFRYFGANIVGIKPIEATFAKGVVSITAIDTLGHEVPAGTVIVWETPQKNRVAFETLETATIAPGESVVTGVNVRAVIAGLEGNELEGNAIELVSALPFVATVTLEAKTVGGENEELDAAYLTRLSNEFQLLSPKPITTSDFNILLLAGSESWPSGLKPAGRVTTVRGFNAAATIKETVKISSSVTVTKVKEAKNVMVGTAVSGTGIAAGTVVAGVNAAKEEVTLSKAATKTEESELTFTGTLGNGGYVTSWVANSEGEPYAEEAGLEVAVQEECLTGVEFRVKKPKYVPVKVAVTVYAYPGFPTATVKASVEGIIRSYLSPNKWGDPPEGVTPGTFYNEPHIRRINVEFAILSLLGTHYLEKLELNGAEADLTMTGFVSYPWCGSEVLSGKTETGKKVTGLASTEKMMVGTEVTGKGIPTGTTVETVNSENEVTLSHAATEAITTPLTFTTPVSVTVSTG